MRFQPSLADIANAGHVIELPVFVLDEIIFPSEPATLELRTGSMMTLAAIVMAEARANAESCFCIAMDPESPVGTVARVDPRYPSLDWVSGGLRLCVVGIGRYYFVRRGDGSAQFPLIRVRQFTDLEPPVLGIPMQEVFHFYSRCKIPKIQHKTTPRRARMRTRSASRTHHAPTLRSSTIGLGYQIWCSFQEHLVLRRLRMLTAAPDGQRCLQLDKSLLQNAPTETDTPARWSFWYSAAVSAGMDDKLLLLSDRLPALRLRRICSLLRQASQLLAPVDAPNRQNWKKNGPQYKRGRFPGLEHSGTCDSPVSKRRRMLRHANSSLLSHNPRDVSTLAVKPWPTYCDEAFSICAHKER
jgi:hypothetical protein